MYFLVALVAGIALCSYVTVTFLVWNDKRMVRINQHVKDVYL